MTCVTGGCVRRGPLHDRSARPGKQCRDEHRTPGRERRHSTLLRAYALLYELQGQCSRQPQSDGRSGRFLQIDVFFRLLWKISGETGGDAGEGFRRASAPTSLPLAAGPLQSGVELIYRFFPVASQLQPRVSACRLQEQALDASIPPSTLFWAEPKTKKANASAFALRRGRDSILAIFVF